MTGAERGAGRGWHYKRMGPVVLRLSSLALRSVMVFLLARFLQPAQIALYGILAVTISYAVFPLGFDFYSFSTREILRNDRQHWPTFLRSQLAFTSLIYVVVYPSLLILFATGLVPWAVALWFFVLVPLEHLGVEIDRILIAASDQAGASMGLFLRQALTPLVAVPLVAFVPQLRTLTVVLAAWVLFDLLGVVVGLFFIRRRLTGTPRGHVDWAWMRRGIRESLPFLVGTLCLRALFTADRQVLQLTAGVEALAAYTLFMTIGNGLTSVVNAGVHQFSYPQLVRAAYLGDSAGYRQALTKMFMRTLVLILVISGVAVAALPLLLSFVGHAAYREYAWILPWVMLVTGLYTLSLVPHFALYALKDDRVILALTVSAFGVFAGVVAVNAAHHPIPGVIGGLLGAAAVLMVGKSVRAWSLLTRLLPEWDIAARDVT